MFLLHPLPTARARGYILPPTTSASLVLAHKQLFERVADLMNRGEPRASGAGCAQGLVNIPLGCDLDARAAGCRRHARAPDARERRFETREVVARDDQLHRALAARQLQVFEPPDVREPPAPHDGDAVAEHLDVGEDVRAEEDGCARRAQTGDEVAHLATAYGVEAGHRLPGEKDRRGGEQGPGR